mmetsp:Transcript_6878/g.12314  ORF Transcript_6878/g.12314 Transcript_6878/m.12314 type:complete len:101 (-) Transcript_6878:664-966(-)
MYTLALSIGILRAFFPTIHKLKLSVYMHRLLGITSHILGSITAINAFQSTDWARHHISLLLRHLNVIFMCLSSMMWLLYLIIKSIQSNSFQTNTISTTIH